MKSAVSILTVLLLLLLLPSGDLISRETRYIQRPCDVGSDSNPGGDDHPWGGQRSADPQDAHLKRDVLPLTAGVWSLDVAYNLPVVGSYLTYRLYRCWTAHIKRDLPASSADQESSESQEASRAGSGGVAE